MSNCASNKKNLGYSKCNDLPKMFRGMITTPAGFTMTAEDAATLAAWQEALLDAKVDRAYKWPNFINMENASTDAVYQETPIASIFVDPGKYQWRVFISKDLCTHKAMFTHSGSGDRVIFFDGEKLFLQEDGEGNVMGFELANLQSEKLVISDGTNATTSPVFVSLNNPYDVDTAAVTIKAPWYSSLQQLTDVDLTKPAGSPADSATTITAQVLADCDGTEISGLLLADFVLKTAAGVTQTITSIAESATEPGVYTLTGSAFVDGTLTLRAPDLLTIKAYEALAALTINIP